MRPPPILTPTPHRPATARPCTRHTHPALHAQCGKSGPFDFTLGGTCIELQTLMLVRGARVACLSVLGVGGRTIATSDHGRGLTPRRLLARLPHLLPHLLPHVLPHLLEQGVLCKLEYMYAEYHRVPPEGEAGYDIYRRVWTNKRLVCLSARSKSK